MTEKNGRVLPVVNTRRPRQTASGEAGSEQGWSVTGPPGERASKKLLPRTISRDPGRQKHLHGL